MNRQTYGKLFLDILAPFYSHENRKLSESETVVNKKPGIFFLPESEEMSCLQLLIIEHPLIKFLKLFCNVLTKVIDLSKFIDSIKSKKENY
jgi:hypothetical protein